MRILVAEDDAVSRRLLEKTLQRAGYEVTAVENGARAREVLCGSDAPRLALLDWVMPELDGLAVCRAVRSRAEHSYVYIVLLTSMESKEDVVAGLESGADDYLTKPFNPEELIARLRAGRRILDLEDKLVEARDAMHFRATHDSLTAIWNRGVILDLLERELARSYREGGCTAVLLADLDHFKAVNDTYGHVTGDEVLRETARRLIGSVRSYDFVGRYGGEEFLVVLNNCESSRASSRAEELRRAVSEKPFRTQSGDLRVTMSAGLLVSKGWGPLSIEQVLNHADSALYAAKAAGRDCLRTASAESVLAAPAVTAEKA